MKQSIMLLACAVLMMSCQKFDTKSLLINKPTSTTTSTSDTMGLFIARNFAYDDQVTATGSTHYKIGSYVVKNLSAIETRTLTTLNIGVMNLTPATAGSVTNISAVIRGTQYGPTLHGLSVSYSGSISGSSAIPPLASDTIDLYSDIGSGPSSFRTSLVASATNSLGTTYTTYNSMSFSGQSIVLASSSCTLYASANLTMSSSPQYIACGTGSGATDASRVEFHLTALHTMTVREIKLTVSGPTTAVSARIGSVTAPFVGGVAYLTGLNISVPVAGAGAYIDAYISYGPVGPIGLPSGTLSKVSMTYVKYDCGSSVEMENVTADGPTVKLTASKPTITVAQPSVPLAVGNVEAIDVTVIADAHGDVKLLALPVTFNASNAAFSTAMNSIVVKDALNYTIATTNTAMPDGHTVITFPTGYTVSAGLVQTFKIFVDMTSVTGTPGSSYVTATLNPGTGFSWLDVSSGTAIPEVGTAYMYNYPTFTSMVHN